MKMAATFSGTDGPMAVGLGMLHWGHGPIIDYAHVNPGLTLTYFMARSDVTLYDFCIGKSENNRFCRNYRRLCYETCISGPQ